MIDVAAAQIGIFLGAATILSIGPNNLTLMREGLVRGRVGLVAGIIFVSMTVLTTASYLVANELGTLDPTLRNLLSWAGVVVIAYFAVQSFRAGAAPRSMTDRPEGETRVACLKRVLPIVWLNPLSYLEFFFLPAAIIQSFSGEGARLSFVVALVLMLALSSFGYAFGGRLLAGLFRSKASTRVFDLASGAILAGLAAIMASGLAFATE